VTGTPAAAASTSRTGHSGSRCHSGQAAPPQHARAGAHRPGRRPRQRGLADAGLADQQHQPPPVDGAPERRHQAGQVVLTVDHHGAGRRRRGCEAAHLGDLDRSLLAAGDHRVERTGVDRVPDRTQGPEGDQDLVGLGGLLDARGGVDRLTGEPQVGAGDGGDHLAGVQSDAQQRREVVRLGGQRARLVAQRQRGADRPGGIVAVSGRKAEHREDRVADVLLQGAAEAVDLRGESPEELVEAAARGLGVERLHQPRGIDQVGEQHRDHPALLAAARDAGAAGGAETSPSRRRRTAERARGCGWGGFRVSHAASLTIARLVGYCQVFLSGLTTPSAGSSAGSPAAGSVAAGLSCQVFLVGSSAGSDLLPSLSGAVGISYLLQSCRLRRRRPQWLESTWIGW
jgi:hypothetical protein